MFNHSNLAEVLVAYKQNFVAKQWSTEKYKWEAVKEFQDNWDVNAAEFAEMLDCSLKKTSNLLASNNHWPKSMIVGFAKAAPEEVRAMFIALFDESKDVFERMDAFKTQSSVLLAKHGSEAGQHYQDENAISTYLWLRYPDKYYIYKFGVVKLVCSKLGADYCFKKGACADNIRNFLKLYNEINVAIKDDAELLNLFRSQLTDTCYPDPELKTLTIDVGFYISKYYSKIDAVAQADAECIPANYSQGICVDDKVDKNPVAQEILIDAYTKSDFIDEVYMDEESYNKLVALVKKKKNVILQGAPGVGKTFVAQRLAYSMMGVKDSNRVMMVQFHQSYSYEDFIMGFRPSGNGFELKCGAFYNFCKKAENDIKNEYFFIIDEINRGNMSKIFGELFMLIESDKRGKKLQLLYSDEMFSVPSNVYIIGMMNTADRSLAMLDYALRRRFAFYKMKPSFDMEGFNKYRMRCASEKFDSLINCVKNLNAAIEADESLGEGFCIGHSYFCNLDEDIDMNLSDIVEFELIPLLKEYWFDEPAKVKTWINNLRSAIR